MVVKAAVLDGEHRLDHLRRDLRQRDVAALFTPGGDERRDHRRLELEAVPLLAAAGRLDVGDPVRFLVFVLRRSDEMHARRLALALAIARHDHDRVASDRELTGLLGAGALGVSEVVQPVDKLTRRHQLTAPNLEWTRKDPRVGALELAMQARIDQARERDVVVGGDRHQQQARDADGEQGVELPAASPALAGRTLSRGAFQFDRDRRLRQSNTGIGHGVVNAASQGTPVL